MALGVNKYLAGFKSINSNKILNNFFIFLCLLTILHDSVTILRNLWNIFRILSTRTAISTHLRLIQGLIYSFSYSF